MTRPRNCGAQAKIPFRSDWERVVSFVIDFALSKRQGNGEKEILDPQRIALIGYSMGVFGT